MDKCESEKEGREGGGRRREKNRRKKNRDGDRVGGGERKHRS